jgi:hypothetical protein
MVSRSTILPLLFFVPTCLYSQTACAGLTFAGTREGSLSNNSGSTDKGLIRQPDGSFDAAYLELGSLQLGSVYSNYQNVILAGCGSGTPTQTLPNLPDIPPVPGVASQIFAIADFQNSGTPSAVYTPNTSAPQIDFGSVFPGSSRVILANYVASSAVAAVAAGDFNNDGNYDFVAVVSGGVQIFLGNGAGAFKSVATYNTAAAGSVTVADLNQDGKLDLVVCGFGSSAVTVLLGNGNGTFQATAATPMAGQNPSSVIAADFNRDQKLDLAVANLDGTVSIFLGDGNGSFQPAMSFRAGVYCTFLAAGDFNGDGILDLAVNVDQDRVAILLGNGNGTFGAPAFYSGGSFSPLSLVLTDFNNDGNLDIVVGSGTPDYIGPNQGNMGVLLGNGDGTFQGTQMLPTGTRSVGLAITDLNADGNPDVVVANQNSGNLSVFLGQGNGKFQALPSSPNTSGFEGPVSVAAADFNGDGKKDIATVEQSAQSVAISLGNGDGTFQAPSVLAAGTMPVVVVAGDLNGDGKPDLVVADSGSQDPCSPDDGAVLVFLSNGSTFQPVKRFLAGAHPSSVVIADVNLDGKPDLVVSDGGQPRETSTGGVSVLLNNGDGTFGPAVSYTAGTLDGISVAAADVNGDGKPDLVVPALDNNFNNEVLIFLGNGNGTFMAPSVLMASQTNASVIVGDFNGDGKLDLVLANCCAETTMSYYLGNGDGTFQPEGDFNGDPDPEFVASADFNNDGKPDLAIANAPVDSGGLTILLNTTPAVPVNMTANSNTTPQSAAAGGAFANALAVTVTDRNGKPVAGVSVTFTAPSSGASGTFPGGGINFTAMTNSSGVATAAAFTANANAGTYSVTATSAGLPTVSFALTNTSAATHPAFFAGEDLLSGIVYYLKFPGGNLFGYYEYLSSSILYHFDMGYEAFIPGPGDQIYFYDFASGHWWYSSASLFPYLYDFTLNTFIYYFPDTANPGHYTTNPRYFSNLTTGKIFTM